LEMTLEAEDNSTLKNKRKIMMRQKCIETYGWKRFK
jgi:hypothetical protein